MVHRGLYICDAVFITSWVAVVETEDGDAVIQTGELVGYGEVDRGRADYTAAGAGEEYRSGSFRGVLCLLFVMVVLRDVQEGGDGAGKVVVDGDAEGFDIADFLLGGEQGF